MTIQETIHELYRRVKTAYPCFSALEHHERCGYLYSLRWSHLSEIPGGWTDAELLTQFRQYFETRKAIIQDRHNETSH